MYYDDVTVAQFCYLALEDTDSCRIWDCELQAVVFEGTFHQAERSYFSHRTVCSYNIEDGVFCINI